jgi:hypothetical protein
VDFVVIVRSDYVEGVSKISFYSATFNVHLHETWTEWIYLNRVVLNLSIPSLQQV